MMMETRNSVTLMNRLLKLKVGTRLNSFQNIWRKMPKRHKKSSWKGNTLIHKMVNHLRNLKKISKKSKQPNLSTMMLKAFSNSTIKKIKKKKSYFRNRMILNLLMEPQITFKSRMNQIMIQMISIKSK
jgi:hypothetical protein